MIKILEKIAISKENIEKANNDISKEKAIDKKEQNKVQKENALKIYNLVKSYNTNKKQFE